jgi:capsular polysaccharide transport system permease protein
MSYVFTSDSWSIQQRVWYALLLREMKTRFGIWRMGYAWMVLQPLAHIGVFVLLFEFGMRREIPGMDFPVFLLTGLLPFFSFQHTVSNCIKAIDSNTGLFNYTRVKPMDAILTRWFLEVLITVFSFLILLFGFAFYLGNDARIDHIPGFMLIVAVLFAFNLGMGTCVAAIGTLYPESKKIVPLIMRPLYFVSGIFFVASDLPQPFRDWLLWNPIFNIIEQIRHYFFYAYTSQDSSLTYILFWAFGLNVLGFSLYRIFRRDFVTS